VCLSGLQIDDQAANNARRIVVRKGTPDRGSSAECKDQIKDSIFPRYDLTDVIHGPAIVNCHSQDCCRSERRAIRVWSELVHSDLTEKLIDRKIRNKIFRSVNISVHASRRCETSRLWQPLHSIDHNVAISVLVRDRNGRRFVSRKRKDPKRLKVIVRIGR